MLSSNFNTLNDFLNEFISKEDINYYQLNLDNKTQDSVEELNHIEQTSSHE